MRIPSAIDRNTIKAYEAHSRIVTNDNQILKSFNLEGWDQYLPKTLQELCVQTIAANWSDNPILNEIVLLIDRYMLLDILDTNLPLKLTIPKIPDDVYWKKCYLEKWPKQLPNKVKPIEIMEICRDSSIRKLSSSMNGSETKDNLSDTHSSQASEKNMSLSSDSSKYNASDKRSWKEYYIEMYLKEYIENLKPENYDAEKMKELTDLCSSYVRFLGIEQMICSENSSNRIPLNSVLNGFQHLRELSICFKQTYIGEQFSWNILNTAFQDIKLLAKGLEKLRLHVLRIRNSDINCDKLIIILKALLKHDIRTLDFFHCKIADKGTLAISKFITEIPVKEINLANNRVGSKGMEYLSYALQQSSCMVTKLDLHLNQLSDKAGNLLLSALHRKILKSLFLSGCGFSETFLIGRLLQTDNAVEVLDISNNNLGEANKPEIVLLDLITKEIFVIEFSAPAEANINIKEVQKRDKYCDLLFELRQLNPGYTVKLVVGRAILEGIKSNFTIRNLDLRMCKISSQTEFEIQEVIKMRRKGKSKPINEDIQPFQDNHFKFELNTDNLELEFLKRF